MVSEIVHYFKNSPAFCQYIHYTPLHSIQYSTSIHPFKAALIHVCLAPHIHCNTTHQRVTCSFPAEVHTVAYIPSCCFWAGSPFDDAMRRTTPEQQPRAEAPPSPTPIPIPAPAAPPQQGATYPIAGHAPLAPNGR